MAQSLLDSSHDIDVRGIVIETKNAAKREASKMPPPDPYLVKFGNITRDQIAKEYAAKHKCDVALANAVIDIHVPVYSKVH